MGDSTVAEWIGDPRHLERDPATHITCLTWDGTDTVQGVHVRVNVYKLFKSGAMDTQRIAREHRRYESRRRRRASTASLVAKKKVSSE